jgi:hypothetical protein
MDIAILFSLGALICAAAGLMIAYRLTTRAPRWLNMDKVDTSPEGLGQAGAAFITELYKDAAYKGEDGEWIHMSPGEAFTASMTQVASGAVVGALPIVLEELPVFLATMKSSNLAKKLAGKSHVARGMALLGPGIGGLQSIQGIMNSVGESFGKGAVGNNPMMGKVMAGKQIADMLGIDIQGLIAGGMGSTPENGSDAPTPQSSSVPMLGKPV